MRPKSWDCGAKVLHMVFCRTTHGPETPDTRWVAQKTVEIIGHHEVNGRPTCISTSGSIHARRRPIVEGVEVQSDAFGAEIGEG